MSVHDLCCIGYITQDKIVTTKNTIFMPGGTSFYFAHAIKHLDPNGFLLVTALADADMSVAEDIRAVCWLTTFRWTSSNTCRAKDCCR